jgi:hypothetical protein
MRMAPPRVTPFSCDHPESTFIELTLATKSTVRRVCVTEISEDESRIAKRRIAATSTARRTARIRRLNS